MRIRMAFTYFITHYPLNVLRGHLVTRGALSKLRLYSQRSNLKSEENELEALRINLSRHDDLYYNTGKPELSDSEYDALRARYEKLQKETGDQDRLIGVGAPRREGSGFAPGQPHIEPMLSLENLKPKTKKSETSEEAIARWLSKVRKFANPYPLNAITAEPKLDGVSVALRYAANGQLIQASTRGDGTQGDDVTENALTVQGVIAALVPPPGHELEIRGEVLMASSTFAALSSSANAQDAKLTTPRNAAAGSLRQLDPGITRSRNLSFVSYEVLGKEDISYVQKRHRLEQWGFTLAEPWALIEIVNNDHDAAVRLAEYHSQVLSSRDGREFGVDGVVYKINDWKARKKAGSTAKAPRWAIAHKFDADAAVAATRLNGIRISVGKRGALTPVAELEPVQLGDVTVSSAALHNPSALRTVLRGIRLGDSVLVRRAGDVIPQLVPSTADSKESGDFDDWIPPALCPSCGTPAQEQDDNYFCPAAFDCPAQATARLSHFFSRPALDLKAGLGAKKMQQLIDNKLVNTAADLLHFGLTNDNTHLKKLANLDGWGPKSATKLLDALDRLRSNPVPMTRFLIALGAPRVGNTCAANIAKHFDGSFADLWSILTSVDAVEQRANLATLPGVGPAAVEALHTFAVDPADRKHTEQLLKLLDIV